MIKLLICLILLADNLMVAQINPLNKEEKLQQLKNRDDIIVTEVEPDLLRLEYPDGKTLYKNVANYKPQTKKHPLVYSLTYDSTIIDLTTIDTTLYYYKYSFWKEVPIYNSHFNHIMIGDVNSNGKPDLYGSRKYFWTEQEPVTIYELNEYGHFDFRYQYDSVYRARSIYDVDKDGKKEVLLTLPIINDTLGNQQRFFSKPTDTAFATELNFFYVHGTGSQLDDITFGEFDGNNYTDMLFNRWGKPYVHILEYNPVINNFDSIYRFDTGEPAPYDEGGFSVADFDLEGKTDMVFGTGRGNVFVIENEGNNQYTNSWQGSVESYHAYIHTPSNDIDKNGKPEFWVLADAYYNGVGTTRLTIFETNGDNSYQAVGRVDLVGIFSFYAGTIQAIDIDKDGIQEIAVCIDENFLILKFNGSRDHHTYELYYIKQNDLLTPGEWTTYYGAIMYDLKQNGDYNILISMSHILSQQTGRFLTKIYRPDSLSSVANYSLNLPESPRLEQCYPNPFNPSTNVEFKISETIAVTLKVFDILGKEIRLLLEENLHVGEYTIQWDGKDNSGNILPGGIYFIQMVAGEYRHTIKSVLLK